MDDELRRLFGDLDDVPFADGPAPDEQPTQAELDAAEEFLSGLFGIPYGQTEAGKLLAERVAELETAEGSNTTIARIGAIMLMVSFGAQVGTLSLYDLRELSPRVNALMERYDISATSE